MRLHAGGQSMCGTWVQTPQQAQTKRQHNNHACWRNLRMGLPNKPEQGDCMQHATADNLVDRQKQWQTLKPKSTSVECNLTEQQKHTLCPAPQSPQHLDCSQHRQQTACVTPLQTGCPVHHHHRCTCCPSAAGAAAWPTQPQQQSHPLAVTVPWASARATAAAVGVQLLPPLLTCLRCTAAALTTHPAHCWRRLGLAVHLLAATQLAADVLVDRT
jgi:hypothetical protein